MPTDTRNDKLVERLKTAERGLHVATVASCNCDHPANISPDKAANTDTCRYRVLFVAAEALAEAIEALQSERSSMEGEIEELLRECLLVGVLPVALRSKLHAALNRSAKP